jgi:hypothetical protein
MDDWHQRVLTARQEMGTAKAELHATKKAHTRDRRGLEAQLALETERARLAFQATTLAREKEHGATKVVSELHEAHQRHISAILLESRKFYHLWKKEETEHIRDVADLHRELRQALNTIDELRASQHGVNEFGGPHF